MAKEQNTNPQEVKNESENVISDYYDGVKKLDMQGYETGIKKARNALFITAGLYLLWEIIAVSRAGISFSDLPASYFAIVVVEVGGFVGLALWTKSKPHTAIIVGIILFVLLWILAVALSEDKGKAIVSGIIVKIIILVNLISALKPAKAWEDTKKTL